jgi:hypothetical protein
LLQIGLGLAFPVKIGHAGVMGASAGVFGLIAAFATSAPEQPITLLVFYVIPVTFKAKWILAFEGILSLAGLLSPGMGGGIAHGAHLGGMLTGIAFVKWAGWFEGFGERFRPGTSSRPARAPGGLYPQRALRRPPKSSQELPSAEFISREVDPILEKISAQGIHSLTPRERQILEAARTKMAKR